MDTPTAHIHPLEDFTELAIPTNFWANKANGFDTEKFVVDYKEQEGAFLSQCQCEIPMYPDYEDYSFKIDFSNNF